MIVIIKGRKFRIARLAPERLASVEAAVAALPVAKGAKAPDPRAAVVGAALGLRLRLGRSEESPLATFEQATDELRVAWLAAAAAWFGEHSTPAETDAAYAIAIGK